MTTQEKSSSKSSQAEFVTTNTGRILRVNPNDVAAGVHAAPAPAADAAPASDPARRADVLFRVRRDEGHEVSAWWMIGAFVATSALVILLLSGFPGGA